MRAQIPSYDACGHSQGLSLDVLAVCDGQHAQGLVRRQGQSGRQGMQAMPLTRA